MRNFFVPAALYLYLYLLLSEMYKQNLLLLHTYRGYMDVKATK